LDNWTNKKCSKPPISHHKLEVMDHWAEGVSMGDYEKLIIKDGKYSKLSIKTINHSGDVNG
jgi:hypothetical protein